MLQAQRAQYDAHPPDMGIIRRDAYGESFFTEEGLALAERYSRY